MTRFPFLARAHHWQQLAPKSTLFVTYRHHHQRRRHQPTAGDSRHQPAAAIPDQTLLLRLDTYISLPYIPIHSLSRRAPSLLRRHLSRRLPLALLTPQPTKRVPSSPLRSYLSCPAIHCSRQTTWPCPILSGLRRPFIYIYLFCCSRTHIIDRQGRTNIH